MTMEIKENVALAPFTMYKIGGAAEFFAEIKNAEELRYALLFSLDKKIPVTVLGAGSNVLVDDRGVSGLVIRMRNSEIKTKGAHLIAGAGAMMSQAALAAAKAGLSGFEWGIGIPGTVGGAVRGNAGCFGGEMGKVIEQVQLLEFPNKFSRYARSLRQIPKPLPCRPCLPSGRQAGKIQIRELNNAECKFGYRNSVFKKHPEWIILSATLKLEKGDPEEIKEKIKQITLKRTDKQDIGAKSCGCIFKNVEWERKDIDKEKLLEKFPDFAEFREKPSLPASFLIDRAGLKKQRVGKIFVSAKHANYFINDGDGKSEEVRALIGLAKEEVQKKFGIMLEEEIQYLE